MHPVKMIALGLLVLPVAELAAFILVASVVGFAAAFVLLVLVSFIGLLVLRQVGGGAVSRLRTAAGNATVAGVSLDGTGMAAGIGGILLVIPGFITGVLGAMVVFPASRRWLLATFRRAVSAGRRSAGPEVVDLAPDEWQPLPNPKLPPRKRRPRNPSHRPEIPQD
jgi:UPF0716 protein FxsA